MLFWVQPARQRKKKTKMCEQNKEGKKVMALVDVWVITMLCSLLACLPACAHIHTESYVHRSVLLRSVLFFLSCLLFARMANGPIEWVRVASIKRVWLKNSYYYPHSHTHRIQMRNENLMILFALLFASFRNLFILHSFVCSFSHSPVLCSLYSMNKRRTNEPSERSLLAREIKRREKCFQAIHKSPLLFDRIVIELVHN